MNRRIYIENGFTLLEVLIVMVILSMIAGIIFASFSSVVTTVEAARIRSEELRIRQLLTRSLQQNLSCVYIDPQRGYNALYPFTGENKGSGEKAEDRLEFCSLAPVIGPNALPGDLKIVRYEVSDDQGDTLLASSEVSQGILSGRKVLTITETPILGGNVRADPEDDEGAIEYDRNFEAPSWAVPIHSFDVEYFDGEEWQEEWELADEFVLPWSVRISVNFARTDEQLSALSYAGTDLGEAPDLRLIFSIPIAVGLTYQGVSEDHAPKARSGTERLARPERSHSDDEDE